MLYESEIETCWLRVECVNSHRVALIVGLVVGLSAVIVVSIVCATRLYINYRIGSVT